MPNPLARANAALWSRINRSRDWWEFPRPLALLNLRALRDELREYNLYDTRAPSGNGGGVPVEELPKHRTYDGSYQDPVDPEMGMVGTRFGRNAPTDATAPEPMPQQMEPSPREVSLKLLNRDTFKPATTLNVLAACWIQMENHDWFGHGENSPDEFVDVPLDEGDGWPDGSPMKVKRTSPDRTRTNRSGLPPTYVNTVTHWWDASQIYGSTEGRNRMLRAGEDGKMAMEDGRLPNEVDRELDGVDLTGFSDNYWIGLSLLHTLFVKEHNAVCDRLKAAYPDWDDERLFLTARLVTSALMAKIHTVEWTPGILANPVLETAMHANWYGALPTIDGYGMSNLLYSFGVANPGAITLHNHPRSLQNHVRLNGDRVDLGTIDILRDRERGVRRYNDFREKLRKERVERFEELTPNPQWNQEIREVYDGDIDRVDLQVGLLGEPLPPGFGFSDTAFRIFILMASRRLKSDRFFTNDYTPEVYTPEGIEWVEGNTMVDVLLRHHPELAPALDGAKNAFAPWRKLG